ncbi:MAG: LptF/LptG family permease [Alphaproteobacteria bacterium]|jgi:lipopolysaccharide export system permease protein|nr:LptF/LptG family permease [Alphaproteobacteria bacterium]
MNNIYRYLTKKILVSSSIILFAIILLLFLLQSLRFLDWVTNRGFSIFTVLYISYLTFAGILLDVIPFALLIAIIFTWNNIINNQELTIIQATGTTPLRTYSSVISAGIIFSIITFILAFSLVPNSYYKYQQLRSNFSENYNIKIFEAEKFVKVNENTNFYIKNISGNKLTSIFIYSYNPSNNKENFIYAEEGYVDFDDGKITMLLNTVNIQEVSHDNTISFLQLDRYIFDININKKLHDYQKNAPREYTLKDLLNLDNIPYIASLKIQDTTAYNKHFREIIKEVIKKINIVLFPLFLSVVASYFFSIRQFKRLGNIKPILQTILLVALFKILAIVVLSFDSYLIMSLPIILLLIIIMIMLIRIIYPPNLKQINNYKFIA